MHVPIPSLCLTYYASLLMLRNFLFIPLQHTCPSYIYRTFQVVRIASHDVNASSTFPRSSLQTCTNSPISVDILNPFILQLLLRLAATPMSEENPTDIVHQLQSIDSIEQDLADTAAAVVDAASQSHPPQQHAAQDQKFQSTLLDNAESIESVLESAIPPAPGSSSTAGASDAIGDNSFTTSGPAPFPDTVVAPSAANDEIGDVIVVETETPTTTNVVEAVVNPENDGNIPIESTEQSSEQPKEQPTEQPTEQFTEQPTEQPAVETPLAPQSTPAAPATSAVENVSTTLEDTQPEQIVQTPVPIAHTEAPMHVVDMKTEEKPLIEHATWIPPQEIRSDVFLPEGLTEYSPSVSQNSELIKSWRAGEFRISSPCRNFADYWSQILATRLCYFRFSIGPFKKQRWRMLGRGIGFWQLIIRPRCVQASFCRATLSYFPLLDPTAARFDQFRVSPFQLCRSRDHLR